MHPPPPCTSTLAVPKVRSKRRFNAHPVLRQAHACDTRDSESVGEPSDGDDEGLQMGKSTLSKAALCSISFPFRMYFKWM